MDFTSLRGRGVSPGTPDLAYRVIFPRTMTAEFDEIDADARFEFPARLAEEGPCGRLGRYPLAKEYGGRGASLMRCSSSIRR